MELHIVLTLCALCLVSIIGPSLATSASREESVSGKIAFGEGNPPSIHVPIEEGGLTPKEFFSKYVKNAEAVVFKKAIVNSRAYQLWSDEYFLSLTNIPEDHEVLIESRKKENRTKEPTRMPFQQFVEIYNLTDQYMVEEVPAFLRKDYILPHHLQCKQLMANIIVQSIMWFSSGGTSSVVHTDSMENMNCLVTGKKRFVFVPPKYAELVEIDFPQGAYSGIDVDDVDYEKYPGLADVKFMHADMEAGDCLYIPFKWIHQVRSYNRNIAVNIWWDKFRNTELNLDVCDSEFDPNWALDRVKFLGFDGFEQSPAVIKGHVTLLLESKSMDFETFAQNIGVVDFTDEEFKRTKMYHEVLELLEKIFNILDVNKNKKAEPSDLELMTDDVWLPISAHFNVLRDILDAEENGEDSEKPIKDEL